jgi:DNA-binding PadR family transcriptional regulator
MNLDPAELQYHILGLLACSPVHGFLVQEKLREQFGADLTFKQVYPTLKSFEARGWTITAMKRNLNGPPRIEHALTEPGWQALRDLGRELDARAERIQMSKALIKGRLKARDVE